MSCLCREDRAGNVSPIVSSSVRTPATFTRTVDWVRLDQVVAVGIALSILLQVWLSPSISDRLAATVAGLVISIAVGLRRSWPFGCLVVVVAAVSAEAAFGATIAQRTPAAILAGILCFYAAGAFLGRRRSCLALAIGLVGLLPQILLIPHVGSDLFFELVVLGVAPWTCGRFLRQRDQEIRRYRELSERLDLEEHQSVVTATQEERTRVAKELHDVVGHCLSVIVLQAGGARMLVRSDPGRARAAFQVVEQVGHEALIELRRLLAMLGDRSGMTATSPLPGIDDLTSLVSRSDSTNLIVNLTVRGNARPISSSVGLCAYRVVQEALTNVIKHANASSAKVRLAWMADCLEIDVVDDGHCSSPVGVTGAGRGLIGMRERVALLEGSLHTGPNPGGGFVVHATLPLIGEAL
jgi:signal transduction histidine kinase